MNALVFITVTITSLSVPVYLVEPNIKTYGDALWWAVVTTTTVGYGDLSPSTIVGRVILMISGIGVIGLLTSSLASHFIRKKPQSNNTIEFLTEEINRIEDLSNNDIERICLMLKTFKK